MIAALTYLVAISALLGLAAAAAEGALRARRRPGRWVWGAAMAASVGLPLLVRALASLRPASSMTDGGSALGPALAPLLVVVEPTSTAWAPSPHLLPLLWALLSTLLVGRLLLSWLGLRQDARRWARQRVDGVSVLVSPDTGPATIGVVHPEIVVPRWALGLEGAARRLMLTHEREHLSAGDPRLLFAGTLLTLAMPWNLPLWWHLRRLRLAVELDCDARVLRGGGDAGTYGTLLLEVGRRRAGVPVLSAALAEGRTFLERRIHALAVRASGSAGRVAGLGMAAAGLLALAVCTPSPFEPEPERPAGDDAARALAEAQDSTSWMKAVELRVKEAADSARADTLRPTITARSDDERPLPPVLPDTPLVRLEEKPTFTPYDRAPELKNRGEVGAALTRFYPSALRDAGVGGTVHVWFFIDAEGHVRRTRIDKSSGEQAIDRAALSVAEMMAFTPAENRGAPVPVWVKLPITFYSSR